MNVVTEMHIFSTPLVLTDELSELEFGLVHVKHSVWSRDTQQVAFSLDSLCRYGKKYQLKPVYLLTKTGGMILRKSLNLPMCNLIANELAHALIKLAALKTIRGKQEVL